jgi:hypothetical protein
MFSFNLKSQAATSFTRRFPTSVKKPVRGRPSAPRLIHLRAGIRELHLARKFKNSQIES